MKRSKHEKTDSSTLKKECQGCWEWFKPDKKSFMLIDAGGNNEELHYCPNCEEEYIIELTERQPVIQAGR